MSFSMEDTCLKQPLQLVLWAFKCTPAQHIAKADTFPKRADAVSSTVATCRASPSFPPHTLSTV